VILDAKKVAHGASLTSEVCIIGSGPAGITLALELMRSNVAVAVLAGGRRRERAADRDLYRGVIDSAHPHEPLENSRRRAYGGSSIAWGGRCVPLEPIDFQHRAWVPSSGWPIGYSDLLPYFGKAMDLCEAGPFSFDAADTFSPQHAPMMDGFDCPEIITSRLERWSPPTNFARRYGSQLRRARLVRVLVGGHATHIQLKTSGRSVDHIKASAWPGHEFSVRARAYVLAAGGIENPRLLLCSNDVHAKGIGNTRDLVGRFYMSHLTGVAQTVSITRRGPMFRHGFEKDRDGVYCRRRFALTPTAQTEREVGNAIATLTRPPISNAAHRDPLYSAAFLAKQYGATLRRGGVRGLPAELRQGTPARREHWKVIAHASPTSAASVLLVISQRYLAKRRLPMLLAPASAPEHYLCYQTEHAPNRDSRVALSKERDALGLPRIMMRVAFSDVDIRTVVELHRVISARLDATGTGSLQFDEAYIRDHLSQSLKNFGSSNHHLGTTRMSRSRDSGVVDANCRMHDVDDLFVIGGSVFPTGGHANPTLTIVALAARLAVHLRGTVIR
jgi:choline dehydrogenase-like flavoprotein